MQVALADGQGKIVGILQSRQIIFWSWNKIQIWLQENIARGTTDPWVDTITGGTL